MSLGVNVRSPLRFETFTVCTPGISVGAVAGDEAVDDESELPLPPY